MTIPQTASARTGLRTWTPLSASPPSSVRLPGGRRRRLRHHRLLRLRRAPLAHPADLRREPAAQRHPPGSGVLWLAAAPACTARLANLGIGVVLGLVTVLGFFEGLGILGMSGLGRPGQLPAPRDGALALYGAVVCR